MQKAKLSLAVAKITSQKAIGFTLAGLLAAAMANATTLDSKLASGVHKLLVGDYDGDQKTDVLWQGRKQDEHELVRSSGAHVQRWKDGFLGLDWNRQDVNLIIGDFNGDAAADVLLQSQFSGLMSQVMHAEFNGLFGKPVQTIGDFHQGFRWDAKHHELIVGDFDGDIRDDVFLQGHKNSFRHGVSLASHKGTFDTIAFDFDNHHLNLDWASANHNIFAGDFDGNGQSELLLQPKAIGYVSHVNSNNRLLDTLQQSLPHDHLGLSWLPKDHRLLVGDFNGDGKDDVFLLSTDNQQVSAFIPSQDGQFPAIDRVISSIPRLEQLSDVLVGDFDADDMDDIILTYRDGSMAVLMAEGKRLSQIASALSTLQLLPATSSLESVPAITAAHAGLSASAGSHNTRGSPSATNSVSNKLISQVAQASTMTALKPANAVGRLAGDGGVSGGSASYTIPIAVPPGRNGMQPSVALSYSSRAGNGVVGVGWSLSAGQSSIHRCPSTVAQDGFSRGVMLDASDKLCLDGQRLIATSGSYGMLGTEYRTELESHVRVIQLGGDLLNAATRFRVIDASGLNSYYEKPVLPSGTTVASAWLVSRHLDTANNSIEYRYTTYGTAEVLPTAIYYTGVSGALGARSVQFQYEERPDRQLSYSVGTLSTSTQRLASIKTYDGSTLIRSYAFEYSVSNSSGNSLITKIQECSGSDPVAQHCLPPTEVNYENEALQFAAPATNGAITALELDSIKQVQDFDGDGIKELYGYKFNVANSGRLIFVDAQLNIRYVCNFEWPNGMPTELDSNFDGRPEVLMDGGFGSTLKARQYSYSATNGACPVVEEWDLGIPGGLFSRGRLYAVVSDFNGDGLPDIGVQRLSVQSNVSSPLKFSIHYAQSINANGRVTYSATGTEVATSDGVEESTTDIDGDGLPDFVLFNPNVKTTKTIIFTRNNGTAANFDTRKTLSALGFTEDLTKIDYRFMDVNGDGLQDIVYVKHLQLINTWRYALNTGNAFLAPVDTGISAGAGGKNRCQVGNQNCQFRLTYSGGIQVVDVNGDGVSDLLFPSGPVGDSMSCNFYNKMSSEGQLELYTVCSRTDVKYDGVNYPQDDYYGWSTQDVSSHDRGIYHWSALTFNANTANALTAQVFDTTIQSTINDSVFGDINGDGILDVISRVRYSGKPGVNSPGLFVNFPVWASAKGTYFSQSNLNTPDQARSVKDGFGVEHKWRYKPLSTLGSFYQVPSTNRYSDSAYFYFASTMKVVSDHEYSNGLGGLESTQYSYQEAMYNRWGRGFQGFRKITANDSKGLTTSTAFYQKFPYAGMVEQQTISTTAAPTKTLRHTSNTVALLKPYSDNKTSLPYVDKSETNTWDISGDWVSKSTHTIEAMDTAGNIQTQRTKIEDPYLKHESLQSATYTVNTTDWWPKRLDSQTIVNTVTVAGVSDTKTTRTTINEWNASLRKPSKVTSGHVSDTSKQQVTETGWDSYGNVTSVTTYAASNINIKRSASTTWDSTGYFPKEQTDAVGQVTAMTVDPTHGQPRFVTDSFKNVIETRYDTFGRANWVQQQGRVSTDDAATTTLAWATAADKVSRPLVVYKVTSTHPNVKPTQITWFDGLNRPIRVQTEDPIALARWVNVDTDYDTHGRVSRQSVPYFNGSIPAAWTEFKNYDVLDRPGEKILPNDHAGGLKIAYSYKGAVTDIQVGSNTLYKVQRIKNALGQWWQTTDQGSEGSHGTALVTSFRYDANGNPTKIERTTSGGTTVSNTAAYNDIGQKTAMTDPERGTWTFAYNIWGELEKQKDAESQYTWFDYDSLGRPLYRRENTADSKPSGHTVQWLYGATTTDNNTGISAKPLRYASKTDSGGTISKTFYYNAEGLPRRTESTLSPTGETSRSFATTMDYNNNDLPNSGTLPNSRGTISTSYNSKGFPTTTVSANSQTITPYQVLDLDAFGNTVSAKYGNNLFDTQSFSNQTGQVLSICVNVSAGCTPDSNGNKQGLKYGGTVNGIQLGYDEYGNLQSQHNTIQNVTEQFSYDRRMRLTKSVRKAVIGGGLPDFVDTVNYQYDQLGNLIHKSDFAKHIDYTHTNKPHQAHKAWADDAKSQLVAEYTYDANGNLTKSTGRSAHSRTSIFNHQMVPTSVVRGTASSTFAYDESNERWFEKHVANGKTEKIYKLGKAFELKFTTEAGTTTEEEQYYLGSNAQLMYKKAQNGKPECYQWRYLHLDRLGSVETITDKDGKVIERRGFDPFGKPRSANWVLDSTRDGTTNTEKGLFSRVTTRGYTGHDHVDSIGVIHMNGRTYDPELGRFMGVDPLAQEPLNAQSLNPYSYVMNNPLAGTDPTGYAVVWDRANCADRDSAACNASLESVLKDLGFKVENGKVDLSSVDTKPVAVNEIMEKPDDDRYNITPHIKKRVRPMRQTGGTLYRYTWDRETSQYVESKITASDINSGDTVFTNGIKNELSDARLNAEHHMRQVDGQRPETFVLWYNPTIGIIPDSLEASQDISAFESGEGYSELAIGLGEIMRTVNAAGKDVRFIGHSQGGAITSAAARYAFEKDGTALSHIRIALHGAPVNDKLARSQFGSFGVASFATRAQHDDPVHKVLGGNGSFGQQIRSVGQFINLFRDRTHSPHTLPCGRSVEARCGN